MPTQEQLNHIVDICSGHGVETVIGAELNPVFIGNLLAKPCGFAITHIYCPLRFYTPIEGITFISTDEKMCEEMATYAHSKGWLKENKKIVVAAHNPACEPLTEITDFRRIVLGFCRK